MSFACAFGGSGFSLGDAPADSEEVILHVKVPPISPVKFGEEKARFYDDKATRYRAMGMGTPLGYWGDGFNSAGGNLLRAGRVPGLGVPQTWFFGAMEDPPYDYWTRRTVGSILTTDIPSKYARLVHFRADLMTALGHPEWAEGEWNSLMDAAQAAALLGNAMIFSPELSAELKTAEEAVTESQREAKKAKLVKQIKMVAGVAAVGIGVGLAATAKGKELLKKAAADQAKKIAAERTQTGAAPTPTTALPPTGEAPPGAAPKATNLTQVATVLGIAAAAARLLGWI